ncbi:MAG: cobyrinate a,c-diamide synthase [Spirochaetaceae bacterium]|jgi:cobyrinic acid a,c-diamide synthase|nr:cobyrinate a,c-diamide synthase [Spirochaetaceae bacterium]
MFDYPLPRICIASGSSGSGKTTVTCGILRALIDRKYRPAAFKCGPDYVDPLFHREAAGVCSSNLDLFFCNEEAVVRLLYENTRAGDIAVLEGVMGFYDGLGGTTTEAGTWHLARTTGTPVILVENCEGLSVSVAARIKGLAVFRENSHIRGVVLNRVGEKLYPGLKALIERETGLKVFGHLPFLEDCVIESRHLGLVTPEELGNLQEKIRRLARSMEQYLDMDGIIRLAQAAPPLGVRDASGLPPEMNEAPVAPVRLGIARDRAFCFYYEDSLNLFKKMGAELVFFSPLRDRGLPAGLDGLYLGGGYPELYGAPLADNRAMREEVRLALQSGMPCIAECGGFMYLHRTLEDPRGIRYPMADVFPGSCVKKDRPVRFGYASYTAKFDNLLCPRGGVFRGHEFHYWDSDCPGDDFIAVKPVRGEQWSAAAATASRYAGFPHLYFYSQPAMARRFLERCKTWGLSHG